MARALLVIDVQNDFCPGGALAVPEGDEVVARANELMNSGRFDLVVATRDWHPPDHGSFAPRGGPWPVHCVQGSEGAELHPGLERAGIDLLLDKGQDPATEGYSGFEGTELSRVLREAGVDQVTICGLATDVCVRHTALEAVDEGFAVTLDTAGTRGIDPQGVERTLDEVRALGGTVL
ncbi:MAG TPA: nicotinamidase [Solirubrobacteraceae bacterium]|nr:nicotinamidase [Solirubrobacteraceae bacterium]